MPLLRLPLTLTLCLGNLPCKPICIYSAGSLPGLRVGDAHLAGVTTGAPTLSVTVDGGSRLRLSSLTRTML